MMAITRYILRQLISVTIFVTLGLTFAVWLTQSLRLIDFIVNRGLPVATFLSFISLLLPSFLGLMLPIATFCAVLFIYNKLSVDSELVVLRAAGLSQLQLAKPALLVGLAVTAICYAISLYFLPVSYRAFKELQFEIRNDYSSVLLQEGVFNTITDGITVYIRERAGNGELRGILVHDSRDPERPVTMTAERGALVASDTGPRVAMINGNRQEVDPDSGRLSLLYFDSYIVELTKFQDSMQYRWHQPKERFLHELLYPGPSSDDQRFSDELIAEGHQRLVAPLYTLSFVLVGLAALLSGEFNRRGQTSRLVAAILCVAVLEGAALSLHDLAARSLDTVPAMYAAVLAPILGATFILLRRPRRRVPNVPMTAVSAG